MVAGARAWSSSGTPGASRRALRHLTPLRFALAISLASLLADERARADAPAAAATSIEARLDYAADPACPDEAELRSAVAQRLGVDPFRAEVPATVRAHISRREDGFVAEVAFDDPSGRHGNRRLSTPGDDCRELASTVALTIAIMVDPRTYAAPSPSTERTAEAAPPGRAQEEPPRSEDTRAPPPPSPSPSPVARFRFGGGPLLSVGAEPAPAVGVLLFAGAGFRGASIDLEGRADLPASLERSSGVSVAASLLVGSVVPCLHLGDFRACALATAGVMRGEARAAGTSDLQTTFFAALGARVGYELALTRGFGLRPRLDLTAPITPTSLALDGVTQWTTSPVTGAAGIDAVGTIP